MEIESRRGYAGPVVADIQKGLVQDMGLQSPDLALRQYVPRTQKCTTCAQSVP